MSIYVYLEIAGAKCYSGLLSSTAVLISGSERSSRTVSSSRAANARDPRSARIGMALGGFSIPAATNSLHYSYTFDEQISFTV